MDTAHLSVFGALFRGPVTFAGVHCRHDAMFEPFLVWLDLLPDEILAAGPLLPHVRDALSKVKVALAGDASLVAEGGEVWRIHTATRPTEDRVRRVNGYFQLSSPTAFYKSAGFDRGHFEWNLCMKEAVFRGDMSLNGVKCGGSGCFQKAQFDRAGAALDFSFGSYERNLEFDGASYRGPLVLRFAAVKGTLSLQHTLLPEGVEMTGAQVGRLALGSTSPFGDQALSRFGGCTLAAFDQGSPWQPLVRAQDPRAFSRDLYLALERCYRAAGQYKEADRVHYAGRDAERTHAGHEGAVPEWSRLDWFLDTISKYVTGYGVYWWVAALWIGFFLLLGAALFSVEGALRPAKAPPPATAEPAPPQGLERIFLGPFYSLDRFVPVVNLHLADNWEPATWGWRLYSAVHIAAGWILVPLFLAAFIGLLKRQGKSE
jgi:hypothetical protein